MSGILCIYSASGIEQDHQRYLAALRRLTHRGPAGEGSFLRPSLFLGVRHSSAGRGSKSDQPFASDGVLLALDGQIHNRVELSGRLRTAGYPTDLSSDPALVLGAYRIYGEQCFEILRGVWALVLWDEHKHCLLAGRDPLGVRPLYYYMGARSLIVASEIKSILCLDDEARTVDRGRVRDLIREGRIDDWTATCFSRIKPVPNGTVLHFDKNQITANRYWKLKPSTDRNLSPGDVLDTLVTAVDRHTPPDVKVGLALSGGIDSSSIAGILAHSSLRGTRKIHAFSINPPKTDDESFLIDATIRHTGLPHTYVSAEALDYPRSLARLIDVHDEPIPYSSVFYQFVLRQHMAEAGCKAVLMGYGADEIFSGYRYLAPPFLAALTARIRWRDAARFLFGASEFFGSSPPGMIKETLRYVRGKSHLLQGLKRGIRYEAYNQWRRGPDQDVLAPFDDTGESARSSGLAEFDLQGIGQGRIFLRALLECFRTNIPMLVRTEDRNAMAHRLDLCAPFMDQDLVQNALAFPFHRYMEGGRNKAILRDATAELMAPEVNAYRRKLATPGNTAYVVFEVLQAEFLDLLNSAAFHESGLWSRRCPALYKTDLSLKARPDTWFMVYMTCKWHERVVRSGSSG